MSKSDPVIVTVTDAALGSIHALARKLTAKGMKVDRVLPVTGVITGSCPVATKAALRAIDGVDSVEDEVQVQLPPPDADAH
jgi:hypothetical protein